MKDHGELSTPKRRARGKQDQGSPAGENSNTKMKSPGKTTPRKRSSKNSTPKKNGSVNGIKETASPDSARKIDLRLEAKLSAEENSRLFAGRQIHPFFSSWKAGKKLQEPADSAPSLSEAKREGGRITFSPSLVHVFEDVQEDTSSLDWSDWTFLGNNSVLDCGPESLNLPVLIGSVESLNFDNLLSASEPSHASISGNALSCSNQLSIQPDNMLEISRESAAVPASKQTICPSEPEEAKMDLEVDQVSTVSGQAGIFRNSDTEPLSRSLQESMTSYYHSYQNKAEGSLWIHKYRPTKATEVCGNGESLKFLRDWLHLWRERRYQSRKDFSNWDQSDIQDEDGDFNYSDSDHALKDINEEDSLENVLLITGPVGSGKSAAVYACAEEQGFEVLELNASDYRNGAAVKQYFGDALETHGFKSLLEHAVSSQNKTVKSPPTPTSPDGKAAKEMDDGVIELITSSNDVSQSPGGKSHGVQTLILVEDVDILFPEDHGCILAIKHIAETAKGPIILTSNSNNVVLPGNFIRLQVSFSLPLPDELLCHLYMVCVAEEVNISPLLLKKFIQSCDGDIRKTIMQLQFWFQNKKYSKDRNVKTVYGSLPFDLEAGHEILPKILPWNFPSELSELIEKEVCKSVTLMEENPCFQRLVDEDLHVNKKHNDLEVQCMVTDEANVKEKRKRSIIDCNEFESECSAMSERSNCYGPPLRSSWRKGSKKLVVMSSESEDKDPNNGHSVNLHHEEYNRQSLEGNGESSGEFQLNQSYTSMPFCKLVCSGLENSEEQSKYLETSYGSWLDETRKPLDISSFPESTIIPETAIEDRTQTSSAAVSSGHLAGLVEVTRHNELTPFTFGVCQSIAKMPQNLDSLANTETFSGAWLHETHPSFDVSIFPESMVIPETTNEKRSRTQTSSAAVSSVSSGYLASPVEFSGDNELTPFTFRVCQRIAELPQNLDSLVNTKTSTGAWLNETHPSFSISSFPESMIIPETAIGNRSRTETSSAAVSSGHLAGPVEVSRDNQLTPFTFGAGQLIAKLPQNLDSLESSFPESMIIPETAVENRSRTPSSAAVSSSHLADPVEVFRDNELTPFTFSVCQRIAKLPQNLDSLVKTEIPESSPKAPVQDYNRDESRETTTVYNMRDECIHADFKLMSKSAEPNSSMEIDKMQNLWRRLRDCKTDLRQYGTSEQEGAIQVVKLASGITNLVSEVDMLFRNHQQEQCGIMEPPMFLSDEATYSWYDEQMMMSTVAVHGFCFYAKHISDMGSKLGCENRVDVTSEMLASTTNIMALGKLSRQDQITTKELENNPKNDTKSLQLNQNRKSLFSVVQSIVPARLSLAMKGISFNEYLSSLRQISISEDLRITQGVQKMRRGRPRGSQHYLSRGSKMLSPEDISLVCEGDLYKKISSLYTANMDSNCS